MVVAVVAVVAVARRPLVTSGPEAEVEADMADAVAELATAVLSMVEAEVALAATAVVPEAVAAAAAGGKSRCVPDSPTFQNMHSRHRLFLPSMPFMTHNRPLSNSAKWQDSSPWSHRSRSVFPWTLDYALLSHHCGFRLVALLLIVYRTALLTVFCFNSRALSAPSCIQHHIHRRGAILQA